MDQILSFLPKNPLFSFTILLLVILTLPPIFEKIRLPGLVGLLFAGVVLGKDGLYLLDGESETIKLLEDIGKIYLMFVAGLEIDLGEFRKTKDRSLGFGFSTFIVPLIMGTIVGRIFGFGWNTSILIGSLFASHTLLGYPIVQRLGVVRNEAVMVTIGATIFTDISALLVLAVCVSIHGGNFSAASLVIQLVGLAVYAFLILFGLDWAGKEYFRRTGDEQSNQFLFILLAVFLASVGAQLVNVEKIVGAFLAGLAVNDVLGRSQVKEKVEFLGSTLFIPMFFVGMGLLIDIPVFIKTIRSEFFLMLAIVLGLIASKFIAAIVVKFIYRYSWSEGITMWSLSLPQVAATLAAALAAFQAQNSSGERLINEAVFNSVIVLMLVTSILGPVLTARFAKNLLVPKTSLKEEIETSTQQSSLFLNQSFTIVVPIYNPSTQKYLIEIAALLARHESGLIVPLSITPAKAHMDDPLMIANLLKSQERLEMATEISQEFLVDAKSTIRIDDDIAQGISRTAREQGANLIIMGWSKSVGIRARIFGSVIDGVFWSSHCPVAVMRLLDEPMNLRRLLVPVKNITPQILRTIQFAQLIADTNQGEVTLLHISDRGTSSRQIDSFKEDLLNSLPQTGLSVKTDIEIMTHSDVAKMIVKAAKGFDLIIVRSSRRRTAGGLAVSDITTDLLKQIPSSLVLFGEPYSI